MRSSMRRPTSRSPCASRAFARARPPSQVVAARVGREALWEEAVRSHLDGWFWNAAATSGVRPVASPEVDVGDGPPDEGQTFRFTATVAVVPKPELADWTELEVGAPGGRCARRARRRRARRSCARSVAELAPVDHRPAQPGDVVVIDMEGAEIGATQRDYVVEVGSGRLVDEIEAALVGMSAGETQGGRVRARGRAEGDASSVTVDDDPGEGAAAARRRRSRRRRASSRRSRSCAPTSRRGCASSSRASWSSSSGRTRWTLSSPRPPSTRSSRWSSGAPPSWPRASSARSSGGASASRSTWP